jgi:hypothetical protein
VQREGRKIEGKKIKGGFDRGGPPDVPTRNFLTLKRTPMGGNQAKSKQIKLNQGKFGLNCGQEYPIAFADRLRARCLRHL